MMQDRINGFRARFISMAEAYVEYLRMKIAQKCTIKTGTEETKAAAERIEKYAAQDMADEVRVANLLAATIGKMQAVFGGELPEEGQHMKFQDGRVLGPGVSFQLENTPASGTNLPGSVPADALERLKNLCKFCHEMDKRGGIWAERSWGKDEDALEFAISVLSELREIKEVRIPAQPNTPGAWELMRDILAGGEVVKLNSAAEAYGLAACVEKMAASVWPEAGKTT